MIDIHNDNNLEVLTKISQEEVLPDYVKRADASLMAKPSELPKEAFALESKRIYPMFDKASTWLSSRYFTKFAHEIPQPTRNTVAGRLKKACELYGVEWPKAKEPEVVKLAESDYALAEEFGGKKILRYPVNTKVSAEVSMGKFAEEYLLYPPDWRRNIADKFVKKAKELKIDLSKNKLINKYACRNKSMPAIKAALKMRSKNASDSTISGMYKDLAEKAASENGDVLVDTLNILDRSSGLARYWDHGIPDPYLSVYKKADDEKCEDEERDIKVEDIESEKDKAEKEKGESRESRNDKKASDSITIADRDVSASMLASMPLEWYGDLLGEDVVKEIADGDDVDIEKLKAILPSLPRPSQLLITSNLPG